jgi:hypothetical protein
LKKQSNRKSLSLATQTIRSLDSAELRRSAGAGDTDYETWFLTVCALCVSHPCTKQHRVGRRRSEFHAGLGRPAAPSPGRAGVRSLGFE